jgi:hypothetical protein
MHCTVHRIQELQILENTLCINTYATSLVMFRGLVTYVYLGFYIT